MIYILGTFFLAVGIISYWVRVLQRPNPFKARGNKIFTSALGVVTQVQINECVTNGNVNYSPLIEYEYIVGLKKYKGNKIGAELAGFGASDRSFVEKFLAGYKANQDVNVFFDSENPNDCYLVKKVPVSPIEPVIFITGGVLGLGILLYNFSLIQWI